MRVGVTFDVKPADSAQLAAAGASRTIGASLAESATAPGIGSAADLHATGTVDHESVGAYGDANEEFDSPATIRSIASVLESMGHQVELLGDGPALVRRLAAPPLPELVFNFAEGQGASRTREARVPALLEMLSIPYTGSDPLTLAVTLDKNCAKRLVQAEGVAVPPGVVVDLGLADSPVKLRQKVAKLRLPCLVKPAYEGSSKGILDQSVFNDLGDLLEAALRLVQAYRQPVLIEEFIEGEELTVGVVGNVPPRILGVMRVAPVERNGPFVYSLDVKRDWQRRVRYECPAHLPDTHTAAVEAATFACWQALGCRDVARMDFRLRDGIPYFLECNPLPGLAPGSSDLVILAEAVGIDHAALVRLIVEVACKRLRLSG